MKVIAAMIQPFILNKVISALETIEDFPGMTVSDAHGFRRKRDLRERRAPRKRLSGFPTRFAPVAII